MISQLIATGVTSLVAGVGLGYFLIRIADTGRRRRIDEERQELIRRAEIDAANDRDRMLLEAKASVLENRRVAEAEIAEERRLMQSRHQKQDRRDELLQAAERSLRKSQSGLEAAQTRLQSQVQSLGAQRQTLDKRQGEITRRLEEIGGMSQSEAAEQLLASLDGELEQEKAQRLIKHEKLLKKDSERMARDILLTTIQRFASTATAESTTGTVDVPTDDMKGRIIGREGRNIRSFEKETGVDVIIDDTPGVVIISSFDPVRREVAKRSLDALILDGRIHPSKIEETVAQCRDDVDSFVLQKGVDAAAEVDVSGLSEKVLRMLGSLHFRTSYSQNVLRHSVEVAFIAGMVAESLGLNVATARRCGLLHDIGKAADHELEGGHPKIGADLLRRNGENDDVVHAAEGHHDDIVVEHPYTMLTAIGDACSASRPGARRESLERYIKRMEELESIATRFDGVRQAFAINAGRELRVIVSSQELDDRQAAIVCREIAKACEAELTYPGEIRVTLLRESRFSETAR